MKIIFLDIDGVLNHERYYVERQTKIINKEWKIPHPYGEIDPNCVKLLADLSKEYDIKTVVSSTWRLGRSVEELNEILNYHHKGIMVIDKTMSSHGDGWVRGNEILAWIDKNIEGFKTEYTDYVILDDDSDMLLWQKDNFIKIDRFVGVTPQTIFQIKKILQIK